MTERNPALWLQNRTDHTAENDRALLTALFGDREGIVQPGHLAVSQRGAGANMSVDVAAGLIAVKGDDNANQGLYFAWNDATVNLAIATADPTNPRKDIVIARVRDAFYTGATNAFDLAVVTGTAAGSPSEPALPNNSLKLATVDVAALASSITNGNITDQRTRSAALGAWITCTSTTRPTSPLYEGLTIYETDTDKVYTYNGSAWVEVLRLGAWESWTPTVKWGATTHTPGAFEGKFCRLAGRTILARLAFKVGTVSGTGNITVTPPVTPAVYADAGIIQDYMLHVGYGAGITVPGGTVASFFINYDGTTCYLRGSATNSAITHNAPVTWATGDEFHTTWHFEAAASS
jgi:hypothetical protein